MDANKLYSILIASFSSIECLPAWPVQQEDEESSSGRGRRRRCGSHWLNSGPSWMDGPFLPDEPWAIIIDFKHPYHNYCIQLPFIRPSSSSPTTWNPLFNVMTLLCRWIGQSALGDWREPACTPVFTFSESDRIVKKSLVIIPMDNVPGY